jgi:hypothetical protein
MNSLNYSSAQAALVSAKVNASEGSEFDLSNFLPYPMAINGEIKDLEADVAITIYQSLDSLPAKLKVVLFPLKNSFIGTYYWKSGGFLYR